MTVLEIIISKYPQNHEDYGKWRGKKKASYLGFHAEHSMQERPIMTEDFRVFNLRLAGSTSLVDKAEQYRDRNM